MAGVKETLNHKIKQYQPDEDVREFLYLIADNTLNDKNEKDFKAEMVRKLFREGFEISDPTGTKKISSKVLQQARWRVASKIKFLDFALHGTNRDEDTEKLTTEGVRTVADRGRLAACFRDKCGVFDNLFMNGDGYLMMGKGEDDDHPLSFRVIRNEDVYIDNFALGIRGNQPANKVAVIYSYQKDEAYEMWPELEENNIYGRIPGTYESEDTDLDRDDNDVVEVCWGWNKAMKKHCVFAGSQAFSLEKFNGDEYPAIKKKKPYIPVFQYLCVPSLDSPRNYGIGEMLYDLAVITSKLLNLEVGHVSENVHPITFLNAPQSKVNELVEKMAMAHEARENGMLPFVAMETPNGGQSIQPQSILTQNLFNEWQAVWDRLYREIARLGINLDDVDRGGGITRGQVIAEEQASNAFVLQIMEYNASETQELMECIMDGIVEYVSPKNKSPLNLMTEINMPNGERQRVQRKATIGMLQKELKEHNYFCVVDSRTGAIPSDLMKSIQIENLMSRTPPGTPEYTHLYNSFARMKGIDLPKAAPAAPAPGGASAVQAEGGNEVTPTPSQTQRVLPQMTGNELEPV